MSDDELAMAYADGELDALAAKRFERRMADEPDLAAAVAGHRALRERLSGGFAPVAEAPVPDRFAAMLQFNVAELRPQSRAAPRWRAAASLAACLAVGVLVGHFWQVGPVSVSGGQLVASGSLATALDRQLAANEGTTRMLVSFRDQGGSYCRVFAAPAVNGIACRENEGWVLRQTHGASPGQKADYRQAGSADAALLAAAQEMMAGDPLNPQGEQEARAKSWR